MAIVNVYIDGFNLYYGALKRSPYKWLDLAALSQTLLPADTIQHIHYFTARVSSRPYNPTAAHDQGLYIRALKTIPNLKIKYGHFLTHSVPMYLTNVMPAQKVWVDKTEEKGSDVNLASHLLRDACAKCFVVGVLLRMTPTLLNPYELSRKKLACRWGYSIPINSTVENCGNMRPSSSGSVKEISLRVSSRGCSPIGRGTFAKPAGW